MFIIIIWTSIHLQISKMNWLKDRIPVWFRTYRQRFDADYIQLHIRIASCWSYGNWFFSQIIRFCVLFQLEMSIFLAFPPITWDHVNLSVFGFCLFSVFRQEHTRPSGETSVSDVLHYLYTHVHIHTGRHTHKYTHISLYESIRVQTE